MGVCKRIATRRIWDPLIVGRDPESVAMRQHARKFKGPVIKEEPTKEPRIVREADPSYQGDLPF